MCRTLQATPEASDDYIHAAQKYAPALYRVKEAVGDLAAYERDAADAMSAQASVTYHTALQTIVIAFIVGVLLAMLLIRAVARTIVLPLIEVQQILGAVANGDLTRRAQVSSRDEVGLIARSLNQASDGIRANLKELDAVHEQVRHQASHDGLTDLPNRRYFEGHIRAALERGDQVSLVLVDLDDFKGVNDTLGHLVGDQVLIGVGERLRGILRPDDLVARLGGDEFALLLCGAPAADSGVILARVKEAFDLPVEAGEHILPVRCSAGQADSWANAEPTELFRRADVAMYAAKAHGKGFGAYYEPVLEQLTASADTLK